MKKQLLSIFAVLTVGTVLAQTPSPSWTIAQNPTFTVPIAGTRFLDAVDANVVWLSGYDGNNASFNYNWYARTTNGGTSYNSGSMFSDTNTYNVSNMEGIDANTAWVCSFMKATGGEGAIHRTSNGGTSWPVMTAPGMFTNTTQSFANFVTFLTPQIGIVNGDPIGSGLGEYEIWRTTNGGTSWSIVPGANIQNPIAGEFAIVNLYCKEGTTNIWFGTNQGRVYRSTDAGVTWNVSSVSGVTTPTSSVVDIAFSDALHGLVYLVAGTNQNLYSTVDGGVTWSLIPGGLPVNYGANEMSGIMGTTFFASVSNQNQTLAYSKDMGVTWIDWGSVSIPYLTIDFVNPYTAWVGGFQGFPTGNQGIYKYHGTDFLSNFSVPVNVCKGTGNATVTPINSSAGVNPLSFFWSGSSGVSFNNSSSTTPVITFTANGTYTVNLQVSNPNGTNNSSQVVNVLTCAMPSGGFNVPTNICNNVAMTLTNTSVGTPAPTVTITSNPATNVTVTPGSANFYSLKFLNPGTYTLTLVAGNAAGSNTYTQAVTVADCRPAVGFNLQSPICPTQTVLAQNTTSAVGTFTSSWTISPTSNVGTFANVISNGVISKNISINQPGTYVVTLNTSNASGTTTYTQTLVASDCTNLVVEGTDLSSSMTLYPNPVKDVVNVTLPASQGGYRIKVTNLLGAMVYDEKNINREKASINLSNNPKGIYFISVESNKEKVTRKIVIE